VKALLVLKNPAELADRERENRLIKHFGDKAAFRRPIVYSAIAGCDVVRNCPSDVSERRARHDPIPFAGDRRIGSLLVGILFDADQDMFPAGFGLALEVGPFVSIIGQHLGVRDLFVVFDLLLDPLLRQAAFKERRALSFE
jgi:hypothetical protein